MRPTEDQVSGQVSAWGQGLQGFPKPNTDILNGRHCYTCLILISYLKFITLPVVMCENVASYVSLMRNLHHVQTDHIKSFNSFFELWKSARN